jgi:SAM-dependent methyltransferase
VDRSLYDEHAALERDQWWFVSRRAIILRVLRAHLGVQQDRQILDVGCGAGGMLPMLAELGTVEGLEPDGASVEHAHETFAGFTVRQGRLPEDIPADARFDVVTAFDVIEHIEDDLSAVVAMRHAARSHGTVVVTVPALPWLWSEHDDLNGHHRRYTEATLRSVLTRAGLHVRHLSHYNTALLPAVAGARLVQRLRPAPEATSSDLSMPPPLLNRLLRRIMSSEAPLAATRGLPLGVSLIAVADVPA